MTNGGLSRGSIWAAEHHAAEFAAQALHFRFIGSTMKALGQAAIQSCYRDSVPVSSRAFPV